MQLSIFYLGYETSFLATSYSLFQKVSHGKVL